MPQSWRSERSPDTGGGPGALGLVPGDRLHSSGAGVTVLLDDRRRLLVVVQVMVRSCSTASSNPYRWTKRSRISVKLRAGPCVPVRPAMVRIACSARGGCRDTVLAAKSAGRRVSSPDG